MPGFTKDSMLRMSILHADSFYRIEADHSCNLARVEWFTGITDEALRHGAVRLHELMLEHRLELLLSNSQALASLSPNTKNWLADNYYTILSQTSIKRLARVTPSNLFHQIALESVVTRAAATHNLSYQIRNFTSEPEAIRWLQS